MESTSLKTAFVLVDNGSTSFDPDQMAKDLPGAIVICQPNRGFGNGCNRGAAEVDADFYFFLNPDTILHDPQVLEKLHTFLRAHPKAGIAAPRLLYPDGTLQETCRRFPPWHVPFLRRTSLAKKGSPKRALDRFLMRDYDHETLRLVDWAQGSALLMDGALFHTLGGFDERYFLYYEDVDLCRRAWLAGRPVYYVPAAELTHVYARASMDGGPLRSLLHRRTAREHFKSWIKYTLRWGGKNMHV
jgi:GT2 family glycosyltransferase